MNIEILEKRVALPLASVFAILAGVAFMFDWSFVIGKRGIDSAEGDVAHYIGIFWLFLALITLNAMTPAPTLRKKIGALLTVALLGAMFGPLLYMLLLKRLA